MKLQDFRVGWRVLARDPVYSLVSLVGLGAGVSVCLLLLAYARYCWQYNANVPGADHVYVVEHRDNLKLGAPWYDQAPLLLLAAARTAPGVAQATAYVGWLPLTLEINGRLSKLASLTVLPGFARMMGLQAIAGDLDDALSRPDSIAITEHTAIRIFGTSDVLGRTVLLRLSAVDENRGMVRIAAILPDPPSNTTIPYETLNGPNFSLTPPALHDELVGESRWLGYLMVRLQPGASIAAVTDVLQRTVDTAPSVQKLLPETKERLGKRKVMDIKLSPLRDAYFDREVATNFLSLAVDRGNSAIVSGLIAVAILVLALAAVNYANLATIRVVQRQRELAMRKVLGATDGRLALQFVTESLLVSMLATAAGFLLACLALPVFSALMNRRLGGMLSLENFGTSLGLGMALGLMTAIYPAWVAFGVRPSLMLMGRPDTESRRSKHLRQTLSVLQVAAAMGLAGVTLAIFWQTRFAMDASPGFDPAGLLVFDLPVGVSARDDKSRGLMAALAQRPEVAGIAVSNDQVGRSQESWSTEIMREGHGTVAVDVKSVSANFFQEYDIRPAAGRLFDPTIDQPANPVPIVLNAAAARQLGYASPERAVGQELLFNSMKDDAPTVVSKRIVGIAPEIRFHSLRETPGAIAYDLSGSSPGWDGTLTLRASGSTADAERAAREVWRRYFPNSVLDIRSAREIYAANYAEDARLASLLAFSTVIAMIIAAFGVYVLAADAVQRRTREIALRKLFGMRRRGIGMLVAKDIGTIILLSALLALPTAGLAIARYLASYTERTPLAYWALAFALLACVAIAALAGARQAWLAMTLKPALALQN
jgi:putative ABC transport system permease protein